jgi:GAF domain-containing protein
MNGQAICTELERSVVGGMRFGELLETAIRLVHESESRFHWTGIYELFPDGMLRLGPFLGAPTDHVFIGVGAGVCGTAVQEQRNQNIPDVTKLTNYLACSTETRSELVVLIRSGGMIHGQIDIDSHQVDAFGDGVEDEVQLVADFLAAHYDARSRQRSAA